MTSGGCLLAACDGQAVGRRDTGEQRSQARAAPGRRRRRADDFGELQVSRDRRDNDACLDRDQVDADERDADPGVDDDALVEHPIENLDEATVTGDALDPHSRIPPVARSCNEKRDSYKVRANSVLLPICAPEGGEAWLRVRKTFPIIGLEIPTTCALHLS